MGKSRRESMKEALLARSKKSANNEKSFKGSILQDNIENLKMWKCKDGSHIIDIIPYPAGRNDSLTGEGEPTYCFEFYVHRDLGPTNDQRSICLSETFGEPCPICEHRKELMKDGVDDDVWKPLFSKQRNLYNIVSYDTDEDEDRGVQIWDVAHYYMEKHLTKLAKGPMQRGGRRGLTNEIDPNIAFADPDSGKSICFEVFTPKGKNTFPEYSTHQFESRNYEITDEILDSAHILDEIIKIPTYDELYELYWGESKDGDSSQSKSEESTSSGRNSRRGKKEEVKEEESKQSVGRRGGSRKGKPETKKEESTSKRGNSRRGKKEEETKIDSNDNECPHGFTFGKDANGEDECENCDKEIWERCVSFDSKEDVETKTKKEESTSKRGNSRRGKKEEVKEEESKQSVGRRSRRTRR